MQVGEVRPHPKRVDWYLVPLAWAPKIVAAPSVYLDGRDLAVHRTHLPILREKLGIDISRFTAVETATQSQMICDGWKLRPYQHEAREFILARRGALVADTMRVGKTVEAISSVELDRGLVLIVAPLATKEVWASWIRRRWPNAESLFLKGRKYDPSVLDGQSIVFCHYDVLQSWMNLGGRKIGWLILDEAHLLSNRNSKRSQAAIYISTIAERVIALTGTPVWNRPAGVWTMLSCVCPGAWGKFYAFARRYGGPVEGAYGTSYNGASNEEEFKLRLSEVMIRRTWQDLVDDLPAIERTIETVDLSERQLYSVELEAARVRDAAKIASPVGALARFRRLLARLKLHAAVDAVNRTTAEGDRVVVWTWHRYVAQEIGDRIDANIRDGKPGSGVWVVTGDTNAAVRDRMLEDWRQSEGGVLVISLTIGQVGIDLSAARHAIFAELDWTPSVVAQAEMRTFTSTRPMAATYIIVDHEIERSLLDAIHTKCEIANKLGMPAADTGVSAIGRALKIEDTGALSRLADAVLTEFPDDVADESEFWRT
jgi:SWI/SNF-related matrix-associated actin-dependent regulator of chromatin subfamily A-like protein 1